MFVSRCWRLTTWSVESGRWTASDGAEDGWLEGIGARLAALDAPVPPAVEPAGELPRFVLRPLTRALSQGHSAPAMRSFWRQQLRAVLDQSDRR